MFFLINLKVHHSPCVINQYIYRDSTVTRNTKHIINQATSFGSFQAITRHRLFNSCQ